MQKSKFNLKPYKAGSKSVKNLQNYFATNYGYRPLRVAVARRRPAFEFGKPSNKLSNFNRMQAAGVTTVEFTTNRQQANQWQTDGYLVFSRLLLSSHSGKGIVEGVVDAPLYTKYKKKKKEFRVHVFNGAVIDVQEKRRRSGAETNSHVRNLANGYVYCRDSIVEPAELRGLGISAVASVGYQYGAVDIIWNELEDKCYVLEINSAPGLEGTTLQKYATAIHNLYHNN